MVIDILLNTIKYKYYYVLANLPQSGPRKGQKAGISGVLGKLNKKNTLSVLEKSKLDWNTYKKEEGVEEEIQSHNKGKHGLVI